MKTNQDYKNAALAQLKENWSQAVLASVILMLVAILFNFGVGGLASIPSGTATFLSSGVIVSCFLIGPLNIGFAYAMTPYILAENPELSAWDASTRSREMMKGHKFDLFYLYLSFIGWGILAVLTLGIGFIWLVPYVQTTTAAFYNDLKSEIGYQTIVQ